MIDDKMLEFRERGCLEKAELMRAQWRAGPVEEYTLEAEIIRNARRYLALRKVGVQVPGYDFVKFDWSLDAAADRLLEGGE